MDQYQPPTGQPNSGAPPGDEPAPQQPQYYYAPPPSEAPPGGQPPGPQPDPAPPAYGAAQADAGMGGGAPQAPYPAAPQPYPSQPYFYYAPQGPPGYGPPPPPPRRKGSGGVIVALVVVGLLLLGCVGLFVVLPLSLAGMGTAGTGTAWKGTTDDAVAVVRVSGIITGGPSAMPLFGAMAGAEGIVSQLRRAERDDSVKVILLRIDSPGGTAAGSEEVYSEVMRIRGNKKVVASMGDVAASGGYYIASAADRIVANEATMTGSIGVIMEYINWSGLMERYGVRGETITGGKYKDTPSMFRAMRPDERELLQAMVKDVHEQFIEAVAKGRGMGVEQVRKLADGRVMTGRQAKSNGLVDDLGGFRTAIGIAAKLGGIKGEPTVKFMGATTLLGALTGEYETFGGEQALRTALEQQQLEAAAGLLLRRDLMGPLP